jgi:hypothetical protein
MSDDTYKVYPLTATDPYMPVRRSFARYVVPHLSGSAVKVYLHMLDDSYERVMVHDQLQWVFVTKPFSERQVAGAMDMARNSASSAIDELLAWNLIARVSPGTKTDAATYRVRLDVEVRVHADGRVEVTEIASGGDMAGEPRPVWAGSKDAPLPDGTGSKINPPNENGGSIFEPLKAQKLSRSLKGKGLPEKDEEKTTATPAATPPAADAADAADAVDAAAHAVDAAANPDPITPILEWIGFDDALTAVERKSLTVSTLLAWAYWVKLKQAERGSRVYNAVGLVRAQWRKQPRAQPRADLLRLARGWLAANADGRRALLDRLAEAPGYTNPAVADRDFERDFPDIPPILTAAVYAATGGELGPPSLMPPPAPEPREPRPVERAAPRPPANGAAVAPVPDLWRDALEELEMQMSQATYAAWLKGTTATLHGDELVVLVRNRYAVDWLENRLHNLITRTVAGVARRPIAVRYDAPPAVAAAASPGTPAPLGVAL